MVKSSQSGDASLYHESEGTESTRVFKHAETPRDKKSTLRNNIAYLLIAFVIYFNEVYFPAITPSFVLPANVGLVSIFLFLPMALVKLFGLSLFTYFSFHQRAMFSGIAYLLTAVFGLIVIDPSPSAKASNFKWVAAVNCCNSVSMAVAEITFLSMMNRYQKSCTGSYNTGHGFSGLVAALIAWILKKKLVENKKSLRFLFLPSVFVPLLLFLGQYLVLGAMKYSNDGKRLSGQQKILEQKEETPKKKTIKQKLSLLQTLLKLFFGNARFFTWIFALDYFFYFLMYGGPLVLAKQRVRDNSPGFFELAFLCLRGFVFLCKLLSYVWVLPNPTWCVAIHFCALVTLIVVLFKKPLQLVVFIISIFPGIAHGLAGAAIMMGIRKSVRIEEQGFVMKYITLASTFGSVLGCGFALVAYQILSRL